VGPFFLGVRLSYVDCHFAPWVLRLTRILKKFREWPDPEPGSRWARWVEAIETHDFVRNTTSDDALYEESYERWIQGKPPVGVVGAPVDGGNGTGYGLP
jgi:glutathione S-transferase